MTDPQIRYCTTSDGAGIAFAALGEGPPLMFATNIFGDVHWYAHNPPTRLQVDRLVQAGWRVVRYDGRGMGSSVKDSADFSLEARVRDLEAVVEAQTLHDFPLCGYAHGAATAVAYAHRHKGRVSHLLLVNPYAVGRDYYNRIPAMLALSEMRNMAEDQWEFFTLVAGGGVGRFSDAAEVHRLAALFRSSMTPAAFLAFSEATREIDLREVLAELEVPTLVIVDPTGVGSADLSRAVASRISNARLVTSEDYTKDLAAFLGRDLPDRTEARSASPGGMAVILFTDIADSTALTERLGDARFREMSRALDVGLRAAIRDCGGTTVEAKTLGDGVLATFGSAAQAIEGARRCLALSAASELGLHIGVHAGDVIREEGNVFGGAVNIAARICSLSEAGEILVSDVVRGMARTSAGVVFEDRGEREMKGVGEPVRVYAVIGT
jgi:class 3 adenylate cyclase